MFGSCYDYCHVACTADPALCFRLKRAPNTKQAGNTSCAQIWCRQTDELRGELLQKERRLENAIARDINRGLQAVKQVTRTHNIQ